MGDQPLDQHTSPILDAPQPLTLATPIQFAPNVGQRRADLFQKLNIRIIADLIKHIPHRYEYNAGTLPINQLQKDATATVRALVVNCRWVGPPSRFSKQKGRFELAVEDQSGRLDIVAFNAAYLRDKVKPGREVIVSGKVTLYNAVSQMVNPKITIINDDNPPPSDEWATERYRPIYPATESLPSPEIERIIRKTLPLVAHEIEDHFDAPYRDRRNLPTLRDTYQTLHAPQSEEDVKTARRRLAYDELLLLQLGFAVKRKHTHLELEAPALRYSDAIDQHIRSRFPFILTDAQDNVIRQITTDLQKSSPMNRLLQGDVGSGKTIVALYALLLAVTSEKQGALMAPTELLAEQHFLSISQILAESDVKITLLTGSLTKPQRTAALYDIEKGNTDIVIGTHAILTESVNFKDLAVTIIDEQHRFGVVQRAALKAKANHQQAAPHTLVMTATPIPRTLSLTVFGDLDVSTIDKLPPGRKPITTKRVTPDNADKVYQYTAEQLQKGRQAYIVLPTIDENDSGLKAVRTHADQLNKTHFKGLNIAIIHSQIKREARQRLMQHFRDGKYHALIATTVIEVGVDVPNASIMIVEHAERFGLAQLHQLRGRVGRGKDKSLCVFIADPTTEDGEQRLAAITNSTDGFKIAEADLKIRGMGELVGSKQSGLPPLQIADLTTHFDLLHLAKRDADSLVDDDPKLIKPSHELLRKRLIKQYGKALGLADVA